MNREHACCRRFGVAVLWIATCAVAACGSRREPEAVDETLPTGIAEGAELSRCARTGRDDEIVLESSGPGATQPNIDRIYDVATDAQYGKRVLRCRLVDTNFDGIRDVIRSYDQKGEPYQEQADTNYDGRIDTWIWFSRGRVFRQDHDRNHDGKADEFRTYSGGKLSRVQRDTNYDGVVDTWEMYHEGRLHRIGVDLDGDQRVDRWYRDTERKRREQAEASPAGTPPAATDAESAADAEDEAEGEAEGAAPAPTTKTPAVAPAPASE